MEIINMPNIGVFQLFMKKKKMYMKSGKSLCPAAPMLVFFKLL